MGAPTVIETALIFGIGCFITDSATRTRNGAVSFGGGRASYVSVLAVDKRKGTLSSDILVGPTKLLDLRMTIFFKPVQVCEKIRLSFLDNIVYTLLYLFGSVVFQYKI